MRSKLLGNPEQLVEANTVMCSIVEWGRGGRFQAHAFVNSYDRYAVVQESQTWFWRSKMFESWDDAKQCIILNVSKAKKRLPDVTFIMMKSESTALLSKDYEM